LKGSGTENVPTPKPLKTPKEDDPSLSINFSKHVPISSKPILHTAVTKINGEKIKIFLDPGSDGSVISKSAATKLKLEIYPSNRTLTITTLTDKTQTSSMSTKVPLSEAVSINAFVLESNLVLSDDMQRINLKDEWPNLDKQLNAEVKKNLTGGKMDVVVGIDSLYGVVSNTKLISHQTKRLALLHTIFGYSIGGSTLDKFDSKNFEDNINMLTSTITTTEPTILNEDEIDLDTEKQIQTSIQRLFESELSSIDNDRTKTADEAYAEDYFHSNIEYKEGRYFVRPIFKPSFIPMRNNYKLALNRYIGLRKQLAKNPELEEQYAQAINKLIENDEVELVNETQEQLEDPKRFINYIPQVAVVKPHRTTTKVRPVFDTSAKNDDGISLKDNLLPGRKLQLSISHLLIHMRMNPYLVISDIQRMFYQIKYLDSVDFEKTKLHNLRDLYRFLWKRNKNDRYPLTLRYKSMLMGAG